MSDDPREDGELIARLNVLREAVREAIERVEMEWTFAPSEIIGVLETVKLDIWRACCEDEDEDL